MNEQNAEFFFEQGKESLKRCDYDQAYRQFSSAISLNPLYAAALVKRAAVNLERGQHELSLADLKRAVGLEPAFPEIYFLEGQVCQALGRDEEAVAAYRRYLELSLAEQEIGAGASESEKLYAARARLAELEAQE